MVDSRWQKRTVPVATALCMKGGVGGKPRNIDCKCVEVVVHAQRDSLAQRALEAQLLVVARRVGDNPPVEARVGYAEPTLAGAQLARYIVEAVHNVVGGLIGRDLVVVGEQAVREGDQLPTSPPHRAVGEQQPRVLGVAV